MLPIKSMRAGRSNCTIPKMDEEAEQNIVLLDVVH